MNSERKKPRGWTSEQWRERLQTDTKLWLHRIRRGGDTMKQRLHTAAAKSPEAQPAGKAAEARPVKMRAASRAASRKEVRPALIQASASAKEKLTRARHRWNQLLGEKKARRFPESDRLPVQLLLMIWGMVPMAADRLRELTWGQRQAVAAKLHQAQNWSQKRFRLRPAGFLGVAALVAVVALFFSFYTFGTTVIYDGERVATVTSRSTVQDVCDQLETVTSSTLGTRFTIDSDLIQYSSGLMPRQEVVDADTLEEDLSSEIGLVSFGYALYVDGELVGATPYEGALEELLDQLKKNATNENTISCDFQEDVEIREEYVPSDKIMNLGYLAEMLYSTKTEEVTYTVQKGDTWSEIANSHDMTSSELLAMNPGYDVDRLAIGEVLTLSAAVPYLTITVTQRESYVQEIPYDVEYVDSQYLYKGDYKVLSAGKYGSADVVANVTYVNGEEVKREVLSSVVLVNPVTEQQARGTKERPTWLPTGSFRWPCSGSITSYFGYRSSPGGIGSTNHKGLDIANGYGTPIYAADGGTVIYAGWMSGYGYAVKIDHGNGYVTLYGHNSRLLVSAGDHVYKGQQIARMGSTGNSTGNHCHFEIQYNGVPKNPLNYL